SQSTFQNFNNDPMITGERLSAWNPNAGISASVYSPDFFAGLSAINILPKINFLTSTAESESMMISYFAIAGYRFHNSRNILMFEPSAVFGVKELYTKQLDLNLKLFYKNIMWSGISYRHNLDALPGRTVSILPTIGIYIKNLQVSYAFDLGFKGLQNQSFGSHYIYLGWSLCKESMKMVPCPVYD
ncbi:MAG: type IX secretion system membrane protein PorP/SprF, partial [Bacteroidales bacterium]|nr:type IX secretion system membrane protein PorP/SprF [Bacteroidales bacterium]